MARSTRVLRAPGTAVFLTANPNFVPNALLHNLKHNAVLHQRVIFLTVQNDDIPEVPAADRTEVTLLSEGIFRVVIHYGFMESPDLPRDLAALGPKGLEMDPQQASYFLGRETLVASTVPKMSRWRMWLFLAMARNSVAATDFFQIPPGRVVELGVRVAI
jgi:KUP system potassium uptake protein